MSVEFKDQFYLVVDSQVFIDQFNSNLPSSFSSCFNSNKLKSGKWRVAIIYILLRTNTSSIKYKRAKGLPLFITSNIVKHTQIYDKSKQLLGSILLSKNAGNRINIPAYYDVVHSPSSTIHFQILNSELNPVDFLRHPTKFQLHFIRVQ